MRTQRFTLAFILLFACKAIYSQQVPVFEKKIFVAPDGKVYIQKALPVYVSISTKPDDKTGSVNLKSERTSQYSNPMYFDSEGLNTIRSPWAVDPKTKQMVYPKQDIIYEVYADGGAPYTAISYGNARVTPRNGKLYVNGMAEISLVAKDMISGVAKTMISVDSAEYKEYTGAITLQSEKEYIVKYFSVDNVGNVEELKTVKIVIDRTAPKTSMLIKGEYVDSVLSGACLITLNATDELSGLERLMVRIDGGTEMGYSGAINTARLSQGEHTLVYYSHDYVSNKETEHIFNFYVDKTPPTIMQEIIGKSFMINGKEFSSGRSQLKLTTFDNKAGVKEVYYSINNAPFKLYEKPVTLSSSGGNLEIKAYALDKVSNRSEAIGQAENVKIPYIDLTGPSLNYFFQGPVFIATDTVYISSKTKIYLKATDSESGANNIQYSVDQSQPVQFEQPFSIDKEGIHEISYVGTDNVENTNTSSFKVMVDNTGPAIYPRFSTSTKGNKVKEGKNINLYPEHVGLFVAASDEEVGYDRMSVVLNGSREKLFNGFLSNFSSKNDNEVVIKAYDKLGNESVMKLDFGIRQ